MVDFEHFVELTESAVAEEDADRLIRVLKGRNQITTELMKSGQNFDEKAVAKCIALETEILKRLEKERKQLLKNMEDLSRNRAATKVYTSKFPFPPTPAFFDKKG